MRSFFNVIFCIFVLLGCSNQAIEKKQKSKSDHKSLGLTHEQAQLRFSQISNVHYDISLNLVKGKIYSGNIGISFLADKLAEDVKIDFRKGNIQAVKVNPVSYTHLTLPTKA